MTAITNQMIYEVLKSVQVQVAVIREDVHRIKARVPSIDARLGLVHTDMAHLSDEPHDGF
jgi:hypothetical protein